MADDAVHAFLSTYEDDLTTASTSSDDFSRTRTLPSPVCCCGNTACAFVRHSQETLQALERDVHTAAKLGKALLTRHEFYIAESERERRAMAARIESLEAEKHNLELKNTGAIEENRRLLDQLESFNHAAAESDSHVADLQATLQSAQHELHRLSHLTTRTEHLEKQIADLEREQLIWHSTLEEKEQSEKSALRRCQQSERTLAGLQEQLEHIEQEAKEERERHVEVLGRMEKRHAVERELDSAASRLKGAAALKNPNQDGSGTNVVSYFVKDILQDNANLQMGIVELREMLQVSNEEVENLRQQLTFQQPVMDNEEQLAEETTPKRRHLSEEMHRATSQELHVHHHYHAPTPLPPPAPRTTNVRKPKKKRYGALSSGSFASSSGLHTPRSSISYTGPSPTAAILDQTAASFPEVLPNGKRWSMQSSQTLSTNFVSSGPSSPQSTNRASSLYDHVFSDAGQDSSRPTTPDSEYLGSPLILPIHSKRPGTSSWSSFAPRPAHRSRPSLDSIADVSIEDLRQSAQPTVPEAAIPEEDELCSEASGSRPADTESAIASEMSEDLPEMSALRQQRLRRTASHDSLLSISGMDIHTLQSRPSQLLTPYGGRSFTTQAILSDANVYAARPATLSKASTSSRNILHSVAAERRTTSGSSSNSSTQKPGLGSVVGGWVFGRWGVAPSSTTSTSPANAEVASVHSEAAPSIASGSDVKSLEDSSQHTTPKMVRPQRPTGINQSGPIFGFAPEIKISHPPLVVKPLDQDALQHALGGA